MGWLKTNDLTEEERWLKDPLRYRRFDVTGKPSDSPPHYKQLEPAARIKRVKSLTIFTSLLFRRSREAIYLFRLARPLAIFISVLLVSDYVRAQNDIGNIGFSVEFNKSAAQQAIDRVRDIVKTVDPSWLSVPSEMHAVAQWEENASKLAVEGINFDTEIGNKCVSTTLAANSQRMGSRPQVFSTNETLAAWQGLAANLQLASQRLESNLASLQQCSDSLHRYNEQTSQLLPNLEVRLAQERARIDGELRDIKAQLVRLLEAPSISFTQERWPLKQAMTANEAIAIHRQIFLNWVNGNYRQRNIFKELITKIQEQSYTDLDALDLLNMTNAFFKFLYITDFWKCGRPDEQKRRGISCQQTEEDWHAILEEEFKAIEPECVILIGRHAEDHGKLLAAGKPLFSIPFPTWRNRTESVHELRKFLAELP